MLLQKLTLNLQGIQQKIHGFFHPETDGQVRRLQFFWVGCGATGLLILSYGLVTFLYSAAPLQKEEPPKEQSVMIESALNALDLNDAWRHKIEDSFDGLAERIVALEKLLTQYSVSSTQYSEKGHEEDLPQLSEEGDIAHSLTSEFMNEAEQDLDGGQLGTLESQTQESQTRESQIQELKAQLSQLEAKFEARGSFQENDESSSFSHPQNTGSPGMAGNMGDHNEASLIQKVTLDLTENSQHKSDKTVETTIPAGAFAKTVLLSGLDASSSMNASSDPRPMLLRIVDHGTLPRKFQSDLKDCHCTAGAYGDLSSERVYARLEQLTCIERSTGEIVEAHVSGYVSGSDGKAGIRGIVASKDGQFLARSLMGGMFAGLSNIANPQNRMAQVNPFFGTNAVGGGTVGPQLSGPSIGENFISGMAGGASTALDRLSQYYIDRAEQLQPVIQIAAGQVVDIVFTEGASLLSGQCCSDTVLQKQKTSNNKGD